MNAIVYHINVSILYVELQTRDRIVFMSTIAFS